jgi:hypothetical protein
MKSKEFNPTNYGITSNRLRLNRANLGSIARDSVVRFAAVDDNANTIKEKFETVSGELVGQGTL